ncbi:ABC transporter permease [Hypericibacter terrae]|jgi:phospholipid/cholesterol/gamma-HCH transport system permease protein|nr:MlaE family lipid ABC transporter permease subunit [Hypericibacter terrae]
MAQQASLKKTGEGDGLRLELSGRLVTATLVPLVGEFDALPARGQATLDMSQLEALDTAGAWLIERTEARFAAAGAKLEITGVRPGLAKLMARVGKAGKPAPLPRPETHGPLYFVEGIGAGTISAFQQAVDLIGFFGAIVTAIARVLVRPSQMRFTSLVSHIEQVGMNAMPIVGLLTVLIGVVLAYQGVDQLRAYGGEIFTVNLVGISVLREMGILLTAIMVAGRSGSAFTAQIGTMQVNEEIDAMRTLALDPIQALVLPRIFALIIAVPLLTVFADFMGILGGGVMTCILVDLSPAQFLHQLNNAVTVKTFLVGLVKAPVFAFVIGMVGCFEGLRVKGSAESVGRLTTQSVVESIFLVIVFDAMFSILFSYLGI